MTQEPISKGMSSCCIAKIQSHFITVNYVLSDHLFCLYTADDYMHKTHRIIVKLNICIGHHIYLATYWRNTLFQHKDLIN